MFSSLYFWYGLVQSEVQKYWVPGCLEHYVLFSGASYLRVLSMELALCHPSGI